MPKNKTLYPIKSKWGKAAGLLTLCSCISQNTFRQNLCSLNSNTWGFFFIRSPGLLENEGVLKARSGKQSCVTYLWWLIASSAHSQRPEKEIRKKQLCYQSQSILPILVNQLETLVKLCIMIPHIYSPCVMNLNTPSKETWDNLLLLSHLLSMAKIRIFLLK